VTVSHDIIPLVEPWVSRGCAEAVRRQVASGFVGPGAAARSFADRVAGICEVAAAVPVASGTVALSVAAQVLGLKAGDEVVVPAYGVISVINAFASIGLIPRLAEIDPRTGCIDPKLLEQAISPSTRAVAYVDFCGSIGPDLDRVAAICGDRGISLIEDAAWSLGRGPAGRRGGSFGTIGATSFSVPKIVTTGQGGAVLAHNAVQRDAAICAVDQGDVDWRQTNISNGIGSNLRLSDLSASLGIAQLDQLSERLARKRRVFGVLAEHLGARLFRPADGDPPMQNIIFVDRPNDVLIELRAKGVSAARPYRPMYHHAPYRGLKNGNFPASELWFQHAVYLPFGMGMDEASAARVGEAVQHLSCRFVDATVA